MKPSFKTQVIIFGQRIDESYILDSANLKFKQHCTTTVRLCHPTYAAYVNLHAAFDSLSWSSLWLLLTRLKIPDKIVRQTNQDHLW